MISYKICNGSWKANYLKELRKIVNNKLSYKKKDKKEKYNKEYLLQFLEQGIFEAKLK